MMLKAKSTTNARKSSTLPAETVEYLKNWMMSPEHINHPYPTEREKAQIMADTGIGIKPLTNWFVNNRKRYWKPRYEARLQQQKAEAAKVMMAGGIAASNVSSTTSAVMTASSPPKSTTGQYLGRGRRVSIAGGSRAVLSSSIMISSPSHHASPAARAVSIGSASSLSSELSDGNSFDDDDSILFASPDRKVRKITHVGKVRFVMVWIYSILMVWICSILFCDSGLVHILLTIPNTYLSSSLLLQVEIILDLKRTRCATLDSSDDEDCYEVPAKRYRTTAKKVIIHQIPHHEAPRSEYVGKDTTQWRSVCGNAGSGFEHTLPTLEEAALMFGHLQ
jgi:hypothetical protein